MLCPGPEKLLYVYTDTTTDKVKGIQWGRCFWKLCETWIQDPLPLLGFVKGLRHITPIISVLTGRLLHEFYQMDCSFGRIHATVPVWWAALEMRGARDSRWAPHLSKSLCSETQGRSCSGWGGTQQPLQIFPTICLALYCPEKGQHLQTNYSGRK